MNKAQSLIEPEPPPPQHKYMIDKIDPEPPPSMEVTQWIDDATHIAKANIARIRLCNDSHNNGIKYSSFTSKTKGSVGINQHLLYLQRLTAKPKIPPPRSHPIHVPTPKISTIRSIFHDTSWRDFECKDWIKNATGGWDIPSEPPEADQIPPAPNIIPPQDPTDTNPIAPTPHIIRPTVNTTKTNTHPLPFVIRNNRIQSDTGANRCVSDQKHIMTNYHDIEPYHVGGIEADEIAITCTGAGLIPWYSEEGILNLVPCLYSSQCDGTLITPTNVVESNSEKYHSFVIDSNCDNGTGTLKIIHKDGDSHATYPVTRSNGLWCHTYKPITNPPLVKILTTYVYLHYGTDA